MTVLTAKLAQNSYLNQKLVWVVVIYFNILTELDAQVFIKNAIPLHAAHLIERGN